MAQSLSLVRRERADLIAAPISAFESETQAVIQRTTPYSEHAILYVLAGMVVLSLLLMSVVKLDRVINSTGRIVPSQGPLFVQPLDRAIVTGIMAHTGDLVKKGQVLATLDPTFAQADLHDLQQKKASGEALVARLQAEHDGRPYLADNTSPDSVLQAAIWTQRQAEHRQSENDFKARIASYDTLAQKNLNDVEGYDKRAGLASQAEQAQLQLKKEGFGKALSLLSATDNRVELERMAATSRSTATEAKQERDSLRAQLAAADGKWRGDVGAQLVTAQNALQETLQRLAKATKFSDLSTLVAPADAVVLKVGKASIGSIADPSASTMEPLFTLTPLGGPLVAEVRIDAKDIGFIRPGDTVRLKLDAYRFTSHGVAKGRIQTISDGSFTTSEDGQVVAPYYRARVLITDAHLRNVPASFRVATPGLTVSGDVMIGRRTILSYLLEGAIRTGSEAMREPQ